MNTDFNFSIIAQTDLHIIAFLIKINIKVLGNNTCTQISTVYTLIKIYIDKIISVFFANSMLFVLIS